jgi:prevent-host-death family protein
MTTVTIREAKNKLTELARRVEAGETIVVTRNGVPVFDLAPHKKKKGGINFEAIEAYWRARGVEKPIMWIAPDFDDPLPEDFLITPETPRE